MGKHILYPSNLDHNLNGSRKGFGNALYNVYYFGLIIESQNSFTA